MRSINARKRLVLMFVIMAILAVIPVSRAASISEKDIGSTVAVTATELKIRENPSTSAKVLFTLKKNAKVILLSYENGWCQIKNGETKTGYASANYLNVIVPAATALTPDEITPDKTPSPGNKAGVALSPGDSGSDVRLLQEKLKELGYFKHDKITGYYGDITVEAVSAFQRDVGLPVTGKVDSLTSQRVFSSESNALSPSEAPVNVQEVSAALPTASPSATPAATPTPTPVATPTPTEAANTGTQVADTVVSDGPPQDEWSTSLQESTTNTSDLGYEDNDDEESYTGAPPPDAVSVEGQAPTPVITKVEKLNWFSGNGETANEIYKRGMTAIVLDLRTGITFTVKRLGGTNHADSEPLTAFDTSQMFKAYGNAWKWDRRPILVTVGNRTLAASMNGMPHGGSSISTNKFSGHFCIHFVKSKTHGTSKICPKHQAAIEEAYKLGTKLFPSSVASVENNNANQPVIDPSTGEAETNAASNDAALPSEEEIDYGDDDPYAEPPVQPQ